MKALVYTTQAKMDGRKVIEPGKCELLDIPEPQLLPTDDMKIRVDYCAMCATDVHIVTMGLYGMPAPWIMGHELCGTIVEVNPRATENGFAVGDKVVVNCTAPCGCCDECKRGHDIFCKHPIAGSFVHGFTTIYNYPRVIDLIPRMNLDVIANREMKLSDGVEIFNAFLESKSNKIIVDCQH